jgi:hypothetical protein
MGYFEPNQLVFVDIDTSKVVLRLKHVARDGDHTWVDVTDDKIDEASTQRPNEGGSSSSLASNENLQNLSRRTSSLGATSFHSQHLH